MLKKLRRQESTKLHRDEFYHHPGTVPGTIIIDIDAPPPTILLIDYNQTNFIRQQVATPEDCISYLDTESVSWVDVQGLGNQDILERVGRLFDLSPLVLEDVVNVSERPKFEDYDNQLLFIARMVVPKPRTYGFYNEQVSLILGKHYLLTVQEEPEHDCFEGVRVRIEKRRGSIRRKGADYLAYALLDAIIDGFFPVLEVYGEQLEELEEEVIVNPTRQTLQKIYQLRRELLQLRRAIWPQRDAINSLIRDRSELISEDVQIYLRDCYDHAVQVMDMVETYRELASGLMDVYLSAVSNKMNEVMKLLTVVSSIFIPLTFIAGIYGMNFNPEKSPYNMPELNWYWGYPFSLAVMALIAFGLLFLFWRRGWLENSTTIKRD
ncbi:MULTISPECIES: magnesium/cobalt transporter CorA [unclassified Anabaena]|uniref:magnesium/cobalt transporter CorA n=1 Tax=unclassified Anabaena TaxID=2619674 RepID=UPI00082FADD6|nr:MULTISPECIES: magnesium/cobalt transporter CorA [unclassified Anabaena]